MNEIGGNQDLEQLKLLSIFYYVVAGLAGLASILPLFHLVIGLGLAAGGFQGVDPVASAMGCFFAAMAATFITAGLAFAVCLAFTGKFLAQQRRYTFCLVMAGVACMFMPFGTVLGVLTIVVLVRDSVKELFARPSGEVAA